MKELVYNKSSWHYRLASMVGYRPDRDWDTGERDLGDICSYWRCVVGGATVIALVLFITTLAMWMVVNLVFGIVFSIIYGMWLTTMIGEITLFFLLVGLFTVFVFKGIPALWDLYQEYRHNHPRPKKEPGFISESYRSWKQKTCVKIKFVDAE